MELRDFKVENIPNLPGCYLFKGNNGEVLYVGKSKDLGKRVLQYFLHKKELDPKIQSMIDEAKSIETVVVGSEIEALILEANLIKKYRPKYNTLLKDDKSYSWIVITKEEFPRVLRVRKLKIYSDDEYYGPYPSATPVDMALRFLRTIFPFRTCSLKISSENIAKGKKCIYYDMGLCPAPCEGLISKKDYMKSINNIRLFLNCKKNKIIHLLKKDIEILAEKKRYEEAAIIRDKINSLETIIKKVHIEWGQDEYDMRRSILQRVHNGLKNIIKILRENGLIFCRGDNEIDKFRIEAYDISSISGKLATGSMVVFIGGLAEKDHYRRFRIRFERNADDYKMLQEVFSRRFAYLNSMSQKKKDFDDSFSSVPDLIIVDGGKGQRSSAEKVLSNIYPNLCRIPIIGISKRKEEIWVKGKKEPIVFDADSDELFVLKRIRDEAHRFAISYHRKIRRSSLFSC